MSKIRSILYVLLAFGVFSFCNSATCKFQNELIVTSWKVNGNEIQIHFEHNNLTENKWTSIAFGDGPGMNNLESIIFSRGDGDVITTSTGYTPKKKKVVVDDVAYVKVNNVQIDGDKLRVTVSRPLGPAGPRNVSLDQCVNWIIVPGGSLKNGKFHKHHGKIYFIKNECAAQCTNDKEMRMLSNRIQ